MEEVALKLGWIWIWREVGCTAGGERSVGVEGVPLPRGKASGPRPVSGDEWGCARAWAGLVLGTLTPRSQSGILDIRDHSIFGPATFRAWVSAFHSSQVTALLLTQCWHPHSRSAHAGCLATRSDGELTTP